MYPIRDTFTMKRQNRPMPENKITMKKNIKEKIPLIVGISGIIICILTGAQILFDIPIIGAAAPLAAQSVYANGIQTVTAPVTKDGYTSIVIQRDIPCEINFKTECPIDSCIGEIVIPKYDIDLKLKDGDNIIKIMPDETGEFEYTCSMKMTKAKISVVEGLGFDSHSDISKTENETLPETETPIETTTSPNTAAHEKADGSFTEVKETASETTSETTAAPPSSSGVNTEQPKEQTDPETAGVIQKQDTDDSVGDWLSDQMTPGIESEAAREIQTWTGWVFDRDCIGIDPTKHTKMCNLMGSCEESGLGIIPYIPGKEFDSYTALDNYLNFDGASKELTVEFLKALPDEWKNNVTISVTGYAVNNIPASAAEDTVPETDISKVDHYLSGIHVTKIEAAYIDGLSTNPLPEPNIVMTQQ